MAKSDKPSTRTKGKSIPSPKPVKIDKKDPTELTNEELNKVDGGSWSWGMNKSPT
jgi:bacteriocin-like protein